MRDLIFSMAGTVVLCTLLIASAVLRPSVAGHMLKEEDARVWITRLLLLLHTTTECCRLYNDARAKHSLFVTIIKTATFD